METWRHGDMETRRHGDMETRRHGDTESGHGAGNCFWVLPGNCFENSSRERGLSRKAARRISSATSATRLVGLLGSMQVRILSRRYSSSRNPYAGAEARGSCCSVRIPEPTLPFRYRHLESMLAPSQTSNRKARVVPRGTQAVHRTGHFYSPGRVETRRTRSLGRGRFEGLRLPS